MSIFSNKNITTRAIGDLGEKQVEKLLKKRGCKICAKNYRKPYGELDIVADDGELLLFVEVKTRHANSMTMGTDAVDKRKIRRIIKTASAYLLEYKLDRFCRFDVAEVYFDSKKLKPVKINYIENAFEAGEYY